MIAVNATTMLSSSGRVVATPGALASACQGTDVACGVFQSHISPAISARSMPKMAGEHSMRIKDGSSLSVPTGWRPTKRFG